MGRALLAAALLAAASGDPTCRVGNPGESTQPACDPWCTAVEKENDCAFCACGACGFCGGSAGGRKAVAEWAIPAHACMLNAKAKFMAQHGSGFRLEIILKNWLPGAEARCKLRHLSVPAAARGPA